jgi:hypothetical protein
LAFALEIPMTQPKDDLAAVRLITDALEGFEAKDQERIIRWAREKVGLAVVPVTSQPLSTLAGSLPAGSSTSDSTTLPPKDLQSFVAEKKPKSDVQFATTVAYYYRFEAPPDQRKNEINGDDLQEGCRLVGHERFKVPGQTLRNAHTLGLLNKGSDNGYFAINSVGENLVAVTLPSDGVVGSRTKAKKGKADRNKKKAAKKKSSPKK